MISLPASAAWKCARCCWETNKVIYLKVKNTVASCRKGFLHTLINELQALSLRLQPYACGFIIGKMLLHHLFSE